MTATSAGFDEQALVRELALLGVHAARADVSVQELVHNRKNTITDGIWRVRTDGFSAVLKTIAYRPGADPEWQPSTRPTDWNYFARESAFYETDLSQWLEPFGIRAPRTLRVIRRDERTTAVWMEDVAARPNVSVDEAFMRELSFRLGRAQGAWSLARRELPSWASRRFLRAYTGSKLRGWDLLDSDAAWAHPLIAGCFPRELREGARRLHREREWFLSVMEQLPRTLAHLDVWPNNVIFATNGDVVLLDWAFVGDGALAEDIGNLVPDAVFDRFARAADLPKLTSTALESYQHGLRTEKWNGDPLQVELGFYASAIKYDWLVPLLLERAGAEQLDYGGLTPVDPQERYRERGLALLELTHWADRARDLVRRNPSLVPRELAL